MKKLLSSLVTVFLALAVVPATLGAEAEAGIGIDYTPEDALPHVYLDPNSRVVWDDPASGETVLLERLHNYAFQGESIRKEVLAIDCSGIDKIADVFGYADPSDPDAGYDSIEVDCYSTSRNSTPSSIGILDEEEDCEFDPAVFDPAIMKWYQCDFFVETPESHHGEYWVNIGAIDNDGNEATADENEYWFLNPEIAIEIAGDIDFGTLSPGDIAYSSTLTVTNEAESGSGVMLDMATSGTDFFDPENSGAMCPTGNILRLNNGGTEGLNTHLIGSTTNWDQWVCDPGAGGLAGYDNFCYYAVNGAFGTNNDASRRDAEGYVGIPYEEVDSDPAARAPIISSTDPTDRIQYGTDPESWYYRGNVLSPGDDVSITYRLHLPSPCNGQFNEGEIFFWGQAI